MLSLLTCSVSRLDDFDPYAVPRPLHSRRSSKTLGFMKSTPPNVKRRRVVKKTIGHPTDFRHELHLGKDVLPDSMISMWDAARWQQVLEKDSRSSPPSSLAPSITPSPSTKPNAAKRCSITPQKRKPVPSIHPDIPQVWLAPHDIPLPPSPTETPSEPEFSECQPKEQGPILLWPDPPRSSVSLDESDEVDVSTSSAGNDDSREDEPALQLQR